MISHVAAFITGTLFIGVFRWFWDRYPSPEEENLRQDAEAQTTWYREQSNRRTRVELLAKERLHGRGSSRSFLFCGKRHAKHR